MDAEPTLEERRVMALEEIAESLDALVSIAEEYVKGTHKVDVEYRNAPCESVV